jgi:hypothetical protein
MVVIKLRRRKMNREVRDFIIQFYRYQIAKFEELGIGKITENGTLITEKLMSITRKRLSQLLDYDN